MQIIPLNLDSVLLLLLISKLAYCNWGFLHLFSITVIHSLAVVCNLDLVCSADIFCHLSFELLLSSNW